MPSPPGSCPRRSSTHALRLVPLLLLGACGAEAGDEVYYPDLLFGGACNEKSFLNGMIFRKAGFTRSGLPYYKATSNDEYLYYDPDCSGGGDGSGRWIVDADAPSTTAEYDLDGDGSCRYHARIDEASPTARPPMLATWGMKCGGYGYQDQLVSLADITTTSTSTKTTTSSVTTKTATSTRTTTRTATSTSSATSTTTTRSATSTSSATKTVTSTRTATATSKTSTSTRTATSTRTSTVTSTATTTISSTLTATATSTSTETATSTSTETATRTGTGTKTTTVTASQTQTTSVTGTSTATATTTFMMTVKLGGVCAFKSFLNGLTFKTKGVTASGAPYFKAVEADQYIYFDADCDNDGDSVARWVLDSDAPNTSVAVDLDQDGACNYHARIDSNDTTQPPMGGLWTVFCGDTWEAQNVSLELNSSSAANVSNLTSNATTAAPTTLPPLANFALSGHLCAGKELFEGLQFDAVATSNSSAPVFRSREHGQYMYWDPSCGGTPDGKARWIIDDDKPKLDVKSDLDGDGACDYHARLDSGDISSPPEEAMWRFHCNDTWQDIWITLNRISPPPATEAPPATSGEPSSPTTAAPEAEVTTTVVEGQDKGMVSGAGGLHQPLVSAFLGLFVFMYRLGA